MTLESKFQAGLIKDLKELFPNCIVLKNDANYIQGIPDLLILFEDKWAALEGKSSKGARQQLNQVYYIRLMDEMSFCRLISPENKEEVLNELQLALRPRRSTRLPKRL